ncbi:39S ribosomal protein S18a, mitochondrial [Pogonomyrmex barbatus]|uniref:39S ribosomal protein S18a, mitochondrial n=1 Tax=Pogonomyrmex barbatus TaxID=144034 RepID=A0A6I9WGE9_9HYME|nr:39S ribosomal protein S18a, mitochondrial [Pogonomyrmex barbatus]
MLALRRSAELFRKSLTLSQCERGVSLSATTRLREIIEKKQDKVLTIEGVDLPQKNEHMLLKIDSKACPLCATELDVKHTDVLILKQFIQSNGEMLPRNITKLCKVQHKRMSILVKMAQAAGLLPCESIERKEDGSVIGPRWKSFNTYYDENTIKFKYRR